MVSRGPGGNSIGIKLGPKKIFQIEVEKSLSQVLTVTLNFGFVPISRCIKGVAEYSIPREYTTRACGRRRPREPRGRVPGPRDPGPGHDAEPGARPGSGSASGSRSNSGVIAVFVVRTRAGGVVAVSVTAAAAALLVL